MRRQIAAAGATLTAAGLMLGLGGSPVHAATPQPAQAAAALRYLYSRVGADGSVAGALGATEDTVISAADNGYDPATLVGPTGTSAYEYLSSHAGTITTAGGAAKFVLAWIAAGKPAAIDGAAMLEKLNSRRKGGLLHNDAFHNPDPNVEIANAYSQSLAVLADLAAGEKLPPNATGWLRCAQRADGGFGYAIDDSLAKPPVACGDTSSDTNDTAIVLQALGNPQVAGTPGVMHAIAQAQGYLHAAQQAAGGFGFIPPPGGASDPDSDAVVIQALVAIGEDPTGAAWTKGGNAMTDMETFADPQGSGGFIFPGSASPDAFTTVSIPQALALKPYAAKTNFVAGSAPPTGPARTPASTQTAGAPPVPATGADPGGELGGLAAVVVAVGALLLVVGIARGRAPSGR